MIRTSFCVLALAGLAQAQFQLEWATQGGDAQRSSWVRTDPKISLATMSAPEKGDPTFQFLWKMKFANTPRQGNGLMAPVLMNRLIGYRGFRALAFVSGSADKIFTVDSDLARMEWENSLGSTPSGGGTPECPGGLTSAAARGTTASMPSANVSGGFGGGRTTAAKSAVGDAGQGAVTLAQYQQRIAAIQAAPAKPQPGTAKPQVGGFRRGDGPVYVVASDGRLHFLNVHNGANIEPPVKFLPAGANALGLIALERFAYAATAAGCSGVPSGVWAIDLTSKAVTNWESKSGVAGSAGAALGPDGSAYVATKGGEIVHLEAGSLKPLGAYSAHAQEFTTSPVVFELGGKIMVAAATKSGQLHIADASTMQKFAEPATFTPSTAAISAGALASWQDDAGMRWILAPGAKAVSAFKVLPDKVESGWTSRDIAGAMTPIVVNGIVLTASTGRTGPGTLWALDGKTGKELWNSGKTITSPIMGGGFAGAVGQIYLPAYDGTLYAFGFPIEH
jgi:outer membrane protein assembly factor BamB